MFTGLVEALGRVRRLEPGASGGRRLTIERPADPAFRCAGGDSVAVNGVCLTVVAVGEDALGFDLADETCRVTTLGDAAPGDPVNLERPLRLDGRLGGHLVLGHVDGVARVLERRPEGSGAWLTVEVPSGLRALLVRKGSVAIDGVSLTVASLEAASFGVALIPHTLAVTTLGRRMAGDRVNVEMDVIGKYVRELLGPWREASR